MSTSNLLNFILEKNPPNKRGALPALFIYGSIFLQFELEAVALFNRSKLI
jgi:hypothetical protein